MDRENAIIEIGTASIETKGPGGNPEDVALGRQTTGLADD